MNKNIITISFWLFILVVVEAIALYCLRIGDFHHIIFASLIFAFLVVPLLHKCLTYEGIGITNFVWNLFSTLIMVFIGMYFFKEHITTVQKIGIVVTMAGFLIITIV